MASIKYLIGCGVVVFGSQMYHSYRRARESDLKEVWKNNPDKAELLRTIHNQIATKWDEEMGSYEWAKRIDKYRKVLCSYAEGKILEIGVGTGANLKYYPGGARVLGLDWSSEMLKVCEESQKKNKLKNAVLEEMDAKHLGYPDNEFDTVVATFVLSSSDDPKIILNEMIRVLKPNGSILLLDRGKADGALTHVHLSLYRFETLFKYGYDQLTNIEKLVKGSNLLVEIEERKQGGHIYFYKLKKNK